MRDNDVRAIVKVSAIAAQYSLLTLLNASRITGLREGYNNQYNYSRHVNPRRAFVIEIYINV